MKHSLQLKLSQHLTLTPQLQQSIRLLQLSTLELNQEIETFLQENPLLERDEEEEGAGVAQPPGTLSPTTTTATATSTAPSSRPTRWSSTTSRARWPARPGPRGSP